MSEKISPVAKAEILIRKPVAEVFNAFTDAEMITKFWFDKSTGSLKENANVQRIWTQFDMTIPVAVKEYKENEKIVMTWGENENQSNLEWTFTERSIDTTYVSLINHGFKGKNDKIISEALDSTGGFNLVIAAAKAYLEHGIKLNIMKDKI